MLGKQLLLISAMLAAPMAALANVITDWDEKALSVVQPNEAAAPPRIGPTGGYRVMAIVHIAMFEAVNAIDPRYKPYRIEVAAARDTSQDAAAASAAGTVLIRLLPEAATNVRGMLASYLVKVPDGDAKGRGVRLGEEVAARIVELRATDGTQAVNAYRPVTQAGVYVPTAMPVAGEYATALPFALTSPSQFRPKPPIALTSDQWAKDYNEIKDLGEKNSTRRTARQTEDARFWLTVGPLATHPLTRQIASGKNMGVVETARFMAVAAAAEMDALIAVFDAKYHYGFWRPLTAIRNGDIDGNPATDRVSTWQPIDLTPMHPEYPCAHCIISSSVAGAIEAMLGTAEIPEVAITTPTAAGVTHRYTNLRAYTEEVAGARIYSGFHYRFSTEAGQDAGQKIGAYVAKTIMQPAKVASN
jgi:hypothetical protein